MYLTCVPPQDKQRFVEDFLYISAVVNGAAPRSVTRVILNIVILLKTLALELIFFAITRTFSFWTFSSQSQNQRSGPCCQHHGSGCFRWLESEFNHSLCYFGVLLGTDSFFRVSLAWETHNTSWVSELRKWILNLQQKQSDFLSLCPQWTLKNSCTCTAVALRPKTIQNNPPPPPHPPWEVITNLLSWHSNSGVISGFAFPWRKDIFVHAWAEPHRVMIQLGISHVGKSIIPSVLSLTAVEVLKYKCGWMEGFYGYSIPSNKQALFSVAS